MRDWLKENKYVATWIGVIVGVIGLSFAYMQLSGDDGPSQGTDTISTEPAIEAVWSVKLVEYPDAVQDLLRYSGIRGRIEKQLQLPDGLSHLSDEEKELVYEAIETYVNVNLGDVIGPYGIVKYRAVTSMSVKNLTQTTLEDVAIQLPFFYRIAEIRRDGEDMVEIDGYERQLEFGEMRPEEVIRVTIWMDDYPPTTREDIKVVHRNGVGVSYRSQLTINRDEN